METIISHAPNPCHCVVERDRTESVLDACLDSAPQRKALCSGKDSPLIHNVSDDSRLVQQYLYWNSTALLALSTRSNFPTT